VIIFNPACTPGALDLRRDMLANVTVDHELVATIRFMGGREHDIIADGGRKEVSPGLIETLIEKNIYALPTFAAGGPMAKFRGGLIGPEPNRQEKCALAILYVVLMSDLSLDLICSDNTLVIDGGLVKSAVFAALIAQLRPSQSVCTSPVSEGSAFGAAALAFEASGRHPFVKQIKNVQPLNVHGLLKYRNCWRELVDKAWKNEAYPEGAAPRPIA